MMAPDEMVRTLAEQAWVSANGSVPGPPFEALPEDEQAEHLHWARRALAFGWEAGHRSCVCDRPGARPCPNPFIP